MAGVPRDPGRLSARLALEKPADLSDGQGGVGDDWVLVNMLWGQIEPLGATSDEQAEAAIASLSHRVTIRYRSDVKHAMRFVYRGRGLMIKAVFDPDESRRYLICNCEEIKP